jgi:Ser/Thr protein kinase RdoA (MazF antagonist)
MTLDQEAQQAAGHWGGRDLHLIRNRENAVFRMTLSDGGQAALRLHRAGYQAPEAIRSELWWCAALADAGLPVPHPLPARSGETLIVPATGRSVSVVSWLPGAPLGEAGIPLPYPPSRQIELHNKLGQLIARIHKATDGLTLPTHFTRPSWDIDGLTGETPFWGRFWEHASLSLSEKSEMLHARNYLRDGLQHHSIKNEVGLIHADVLRENVLVNDGSLSIIDFDDSGLGFRLYDLGTVLSQNLSEPTYPELRAALIEGYGHPDAAAVDLFTLARTLASVGWTMPRLAQNDPIMRSHIERALRFARLIMS